MQLPKVILDNQEPMRSDDRAVSVDGVDYRLTRHGRARYIERVGPATDEEILRKCVGDPRAVWAPDSSDGLRLITYLSTTRMKEIDTAEDYLDTLYEDQF